MNKLISDSKKGKTSLGERYRCHTFEPHGEKRFLYKITRFRVLRSAPQREIRGPASPRKYTHQQYFPTFRSYRALYNPRGQIIIHTALINKSIFHHWYNVVYKWSRNVTNRLIEKEYKPKQMHKRCNKELCSYFGIIGIYLSLVLVCCLYFSISNRDSLCPTLS